MSPRSAAMMVAQGLAALILAVFLATPCLSGTEFGAPQALLLAIPVLALPLQRVLTGKNVLAVPGVGRRPWAIRPLFAGLPDLLRISGLLLLVVALARPWITHREEITQTPGLDILLAIDTSGSMRADDMRTKYGFASRIDVAKGVAQEFVAGRSHDRIGVVPFGEEAFTWVPLTLDHETLSDSIGQVDIGMAGSRGTAVGTAIAVSAKRMKKLDSPSRVVILVTDGRSNTGRIEPIAAAQAAGALGMRVYTIGVGGDGGGIFGMSPDEGVDEPTLRQIAKLTGGRYFRATDQRTLEQVYATIDDLEKSPAKTKELVEHDERFACPLTKGAILLLIGAFLQATILRRGP